MSRVLQRCTLLLMFLVAAAPSVTAQTSPAASSPEQQLKDLQRESREQVDRFKKGALTADPRPELAARFWVLSEKSAGTAVAGTAARDSLRLLVDAGRMDEALLKLNDLPASDPAWASGALSILRELAVSKNDAAIFVNRARALLAASTEPGMRARIQYSMGRFYQAGARPDEAVPAFEAAVAEGADMEFAKRSARELYDMRVLIVGKPAPAFSAATLSGKPISAEGLRGHVTVFVYWASW